MYCQLSVKVSHWVWILKQQFIVTCLTWCHTEPNFEAIVCSDLSVKIYITDPESYRNSLLWPVSEDISHWIFKQQFTSNCQWKYLTEPETLHNSLLWPVSKDISHWASIISNSSQWPVSENISLILNLEAVVYRNLSTNSSHSVFKRQAYSDLSTKSSYWVWVFKRQLYSDLSTKSSYWVWVFMRQAYSDLSTKSSYWVWVSLTLGVQLSPLM